MSGVSSRDYPNYQKTIEIISKETFETQVEKGSAWIGTPEEIRKAIAAYDREVGGFESASLQVNFGMIGQAEAEPSMRLFAREVMPYFRELKEAPMSVAAAATATACRRDIPTLEALYEAAGGVNFTPGWVPRKKPILWARAAVGVRPGALDLGGRQGRPRRRRPADRRLARRAPQPGDAQSRAGRQLRDQPHAGLRLPDDPARREGALAPALLACAARHHRRQGLVLDRQRREDADGDRRRRAHARLVLARPRP